jgi:hypothetical protein
VNRGTPPFKDGEFLGVKPIGHAIGSKYVMTGCCMMPAMMMRRRLNLRPSWRGYHEDR